MNPLNNEYFGSNTTLDEKAYDHVLAAVVTFAEKVDIKDTNIEEGIDIYSPGDEYLGLFVLPSLLDACGVSYERVIGGCIATTTRGGGSAVGPYHHIPFCRNFSLWRERVVNSYSIPNSIFNTGVGIY